MTRSAKAKQMYSLDGESDEVWNLQIDLLDDVIDGGLARSICGIAERYLLADLDDKGRYQDEFGAGREEGSKGLV